MHAVSDNDERVPSNAGCSAEDTDADGDVWFDAADDLDTISEQDREEVLWHESQGSC